MDRMLSGDKEKSQKQPLLKDTGLNHKLALGKLLPQKNQSLAHKNNLNGP